MKLCARSRTRLLVCALGLRHALGLFLSFVAQDTTWSVFIATSPVPCYRRTGGKREKRGIGRRHPPIRIQRAPCADVFNAGTCGFSREILQRVAFFEGVVSYAVCTSVVLKRVFTAVAFTNVKTTTTTTTAVSRGSVVTPWEITGGIKLCIPAVCRLSEGTATYQAAHSRRTTVDTPDSSRRVG